MILEGWLLVSVLVSLFICLVVVEIGRYRVGYFGGFFGIGVSGRYMVGMG